MLTAAGCGGAAEQAATPAVPKLPRALAQTWAQQADAIAGAVAAGDGCSAQTRAALLRAQVVAAVNAHRVPRRYLEPLVGAVNDIPERISCTPAPAPKPAEPAKHGKHGKHDKHGDGGN